MVCRRAIFFIAFEAMEFAYNRQHHRADNS